MGDFTTKIRLVFVPLFGTLLAVTAVYSALHWFLAARPDWIPIDDDVWMIWAPIAIGFAIAMWMAVAGFKKLALTERAASGVFMLAWATVVAPLLIAQVYISDEAGSVSQVGSASDIAYAPSSRFYIANSTCLDRNNILVRPTAQVHGRNNEDLEFSIYVAVAVCGDNAKQGGSNVWVALVYRKWVSNRMSESEKDAAYRAFFPEADKQFNAEDPRRYRYLERLGAGEERTALEKAFGKAKRDSSRAIILVPHNDAFEQRADGWLKAAAIALVAGMGVWALLLALVRMKTFDEVEAQKAQEATEAQELRAEGLRGGKSSGLLIPTRQFYGLPVLLDINLLVFIAMVGSGLGFISFETDDLVNWGANYGPLIHGLGVFRLISSQFVHAGIMHIASNMYGLLIVGAYLLPVTTNSRLIGCYLVAGLGASLTSVWVHPDIVSVGASGALFGLCGILIVLLLLRDPRVSAARGPMLLNMAVYVGLNLAFGAATPGIDNAAHVGGLITGLVIGVVLYVWDRAWQLKWVGDRTEHTDLTDGS